MFKTSTNFEKLLDKATSLSNLEPDWTSILQICDSIRQNDVQPRYALNAIKKKLNATNPNVQLMTLQVLESCVKNCGSVFHYELATKEFMEELHVLLKNSPDNKVKTEILRLVQAWSHAFRKEPSFKAVQDQMRLMKAEGFQFPTFKESDVMYNADQAPGWSDGERCNRCRMQFSMLIRKHHCRACGQVFCAKCSSRTSTIPKYGIEKEVRVCDVCYDKINKKIEVKHSPNEETKPKMMGTDTSVAGAATTPSPVKTKSEQEIQEEEELQLALALSKSEAETREYEKMRNYSKQKSMGTSNYHNSNNIGACLQSNNDHSSSSMKLHHKKSSKSGKTGGSSSKTNLKKSHIDADQFKEDEDSELAKYLNREYWEQRAQGGGGGGGFGDYENSPSPSAPQPSGKTDSTTQSSQSLQQQQSQSLSVNKSVQQHVGHQDEEELETFTKQLRSTIEIFVNRLNSNKLRGRPITLDNGVQAVFMNLTNMHSHLMMYMQQTSEARSNCERLQDKINQIRDARAALDALRDEHREQLKRMAAEAELIRQQQMAQKLEIMRKKKQEYLQYQRELALQRMHEQERELRMRTEQLKFATAQANQNTSGVPGSMAMVNHGQPWSPMVQPATGYVPSTQVVNSNYYMENVGTFPTPGQTGHHQPTVQPPPMIGTTGQPMMVATGQPQQQPQYASIPQPTPPTSATMVAAHPGMMQSQPPPAMQLPPQPGMMPHGMVPPQMMPQHYPPHQMYAGYANEMAGGQPQPQYVGNNSNVSVEPPHQQQQQQPNSAVVKEELLINFD